MSPVHQQGNQTSSHVIFTSSTFRVQESTLAAMGEAFTNNAAAGDVVDKLVKAIGGKFNGTGFDVWCRTAKSVISLRHPGVSSLIDGRPCPDAVRRSPAGIISRASIVTDNVPTSTMWEEHNDVTNLEDIRDWFRARTTLFPSQSDLNRHALSLCLLSRTVQPRPRHHRCLLPH